MKQISEISSPIWVFGYGSLIWNPGFTPAHKEIAYLKNYARSFCMWSVHYRGTPKRPGLVLALNAQKGTHCTGIAFKIEQNHAESVLKMLRERELITEAYQEKILPIRLKSGKEVAAFCYVIDPNHGQYCAHLSHAQQAEIIAHAHGKRGKNTEYLYQTVEHLEALGIKDESLCTLASTLRSMEGKTI